MQPNQFALRIVHANNGLKGRLFQGSPLCTGANDSRPLPPHVNGAGSLTGSVELNALAVQPDLAAPDVVHRRLAVIQVAFAAGPVVRDSGRRAVRYER